MNASMTRFRIALAAALLAVPAVAPLGAQAWMYPSFQMPRVTPREMNFALADAGNLGTSLLFQWRQGQGVRSQLSFDVGVTDINNAGPANGDQQLLLLGGQFAHQLARSTADMPFDLLLTAGVNAALGDGSVFRVPVGLSVGHRFPIEGGAALTPFVHPRLVYSHCGRCSDPSDLGLEFDLGGEFEFNSAFALRLSASLGNNYFTNDDSFGASLAWHPGRRR